MINHMKVKVWRWRSPNPGGEHAHKAPILINISLIEPNAQCGVLSLPLSQAIGLFGEEMVSKITEEPIYADLSLEADI